MTVVILKIKYMAVWTLETEIDCTSFSFPVEEDKSFFQEVLKNYFEESKPVLEQWRSLLMVRGEPKRYSDFFLVDDSAVVAISQKAAEGFRKVLDKKVELLPIETDMGKYYAINVINFIDCLNKPDSIYTATNSGVIVNYAQLEFDETRLDGNAIFKIPELPYITLITDDIRTLCARESLRGLMFDKKVNRVWYS